METNEKYILQSVANTLDILDLLAEQQNLSVPEISEKSGLGKVLFFVSLPLLNQKIMCRNQSLPVTR